ncbi:hypothetical protein [Tenacibaculum finnmarkense]|uniref:hypothetical protein n=1 Tax=Tenacibaculum finnmarkense TaxID=2781243 RepID=UPI00187B6FB1|nr:hypothetical protein [Tenacibaculum finnmarkense]MBE7689072.1 hypothetical protein [Tenacibaculum finnmarkense genomovar ulcerans]MCG8860017.1 hypothetical protein [Tenacibaculum finnmarkense]
MITNKIRQIESFRRTRSGEIGDDFLLNITMDLLKQLSLRNNFIHKILKEYKLTESSVDDNLRIATGLYISSLITCWETFFRDIYIFLVNTDTVINEKIKKKAPEKLPLDISLGEYSARKYNFQNLNHTREAFDYIFEKETSKLSDYFTDEDLKNIIITDFPFILEWISKSKLHRKIDDILNNAFDIRHKTIHDSNYLIPFDSEKLIEIECIFQVIPQFFISKIAKNYGQKRIVFNTINSSVRFTDKPTEDEFSYAFTAEDFMANDFEILE